MARDGREGKGWMIFNRKGCNKKERDEKGINVEEFEGKCKNFSGLHLQL